MRRFGLTLSLVLLLGAGTSVEAEGAPVRAGKAAAKRGPAPKRDGRARKHQPGSTRRLRDRAHTRSRLQVKRVNARKRAMSAHLRPKLREHAYLGVRERGRNLEISVFTDRGARRVVLESASGRELIQWIERYADEQGLKFVGAAIRGSLKTPELQSKLWLEHDIVVVAGSGARSTSAGRLARYARAHFDGDHNAKIRIDKQRRVRMTAPLVTPRDYRKLVSPREYQRLVKLAREARDKGLKIVFIGATARGGGVAFMRHATVVRLLGQLGVDAEWRVMPEDPAVFEITKQKIHNAFQDKGDAKDALTERDVARLEAWSKKAAKTFGDVLSRERAVFIIDDYQPSGLIPIIRKVNPTAKIVFRAHTELRTDLIAREGSRANKAWQLVRNNLDAGVDLLLFHPVDKFVPEQASARWKDKIRMMPPATDRLDGLNKPLAPEQLAHYFQLFNQHLKSNGQSPLDPKRPHIHQIARFDPSKGIPHVLEAFHLLRKKLLEGGVDRSKLPQLVLTGHGSVDDPEGQTVLKETLGALKSSRYRSMAADVKVARLPHNDQMLNMIRSTSEAALQMSTAEGWEIEISGARRQGNPVVVSRTGGMPPQVGRGGYLVKPGDSAAAAEHLFQLLTREGLHQRVSEKARNVSSRAFTWRNTTNWLEIANRLAEGRVPEQERLYPRE